MTLHEIEELRGSIYAEASTERDLTVPNILLLLEQLVELEKQERIKICGIFTPEAHINDRTEVMVFVSPFEGEKIFPTIKGLNEFRKQHIIADLLIPAQSDEDACNTFKAEVDETLRNHIEDGSIFVPTATFKDVTADIVDEVTRKRIPYTMTSPALRVLGFEKTPLPNQNVGRKTTSSEEIVTTVYIHPNAQVAKLAAQSVQFLYMRREVVLGHTNIFSTFHYLVARCIQKRHLDQIRASRFELVNPEKYLRDLGIPLSNQEAEVTLSR